MDPDEMTTAQVAAALGVARTTISRLGPERLPYRASPRGHRYYRRADVEAYKAGLLAPAVPGLAARVAGLEERVTKLEGRR